MERPRRGHRRVDLAERARRAAPRIGDGLQPVLREPLVQRLEVVVAHEDLAAHLDHVGRALRQRVRDVRHHADVGGDVLALVAVAAGGGGDEPAVLVADRAGQAVDLGLGGDGERLVGGEPEEAADAGEELDHVLLGEGVVERQHRHGVDDLAEAPDRRRADPLARTVRALELREARLDARGCAGEARHSRRRRSRGSSCW